MGKKSIELLDYSKMCSKDEEYGYFNDIHKLNRCFIDSCKFDNDLRGKNVIGIHKNTLKKQGYFTLNN